MTKHATTPVMARYSKRGWTVSETLELFPGATEAWLVFAPHDEGPPGMDLRTRAKLGSVLVHVAEWLSPDGHDYDRVALEQLLADADVRAFLASVPNVLLPAKRRPT